MGQCAYFGIHYTPPLTNAYNSAVRSEVMYPLCTCPTGRPSASGSQNLSQPTLKNSSTVGRSVHQTKREATATLNSNKRCNKGTFAFRFISANYIAKAGQDEAQVSHPKSSRENWMNVLRMQKWAWNRLSCCYWLLKAAPVEVISSMSDIEMSSVRTCVGVRQRARALRCPCWPDGLPGAAFKVLLCLLRGSIAKPLTAFGQCAPVALLLHVWAH